MNGIGGIGAPPRVSVIVAARNAAASLPRLLACLEAQTLSPESFEVLVVDDCSTDRTAELVRESGRARLLRTPRRGGAYAARNVGLREARGEVIAITDADCEPRPEWLERGLEDRDSTGTDLLGGHIEVPTRPRPSVSELIDLARFLDQRRSVTELGFATAANLFVGADVIGRLGGFDERLRSGGDIEFSKRATAAGFTLAYSPRSIVLHQPRRTVGGLARKAYRVGFGHAQLTLHRHPGYDSRPLLWSRPGFYRPHHRLLGRERVEAAGHLPDDRLRELQLEAGQYLFLQLPMIAGSVAATVQERPQR